MASLTIQGPDEVNGWSHSALSFRLKSGSITGMRLVKPSVLERGAPLRPTFARRFERWGAVILRNPSPPNTPITIEVSTTADTTVEACRAWNQYEWKDGRGAEGPVAGLGVAPKLIDELENHSIEGAGEVASAARFFRALDLASVPQLMLDRNIGAASERQAAGLLAGSVCGALMQRVLARTDPNPKRQWPRLPRHHLAFWSELILELLRAEKLVAGGDTVTRAESAFLAFGAGRLQVEIFDGGIGVPSRMNNGAPNSMMIFGLPELAVAAVENDVNGSIWEALLPSLLAACEACITCYVTQGGPGDPTFHTHPPATLQDVSLHALLSKWKSFRQDAWQQEYAKLIRGVLPLLNDAPLRFRQQPTQGNSVEFVEKRDPPILAVRPIAAPSATQA